MIAQTIADAFDRCARDGRAALIPYLMAGDPAPSMTARLIEAAFDGGADIVEVGLPYSDPLADGPTIQAAAKRALDAGTSFDGVLEAVASLGRARTRPLVAFSYYNPIFVRGLQRSASDLSAAGFSGVIVPDLPPEEADEAVAAFDAADIALAFLVAPTTPLDRVASIAAASRGFIYVVSRMGVTGADASLGDAVAGLVGRVRPFTDKPLAVGFGVATPENAKTIAAYADGVIVGSALVARAAAAADKPQAVRGFCAALGAAMRGARSGSAGSGLTRRPRCATARQRSPPRRG